MKEQFFVICPKCGSIDITGDLIDETGVPVGQASIMIKYKCHNCNYISRIFPKVNKDKIKNFRNQLKIK